MILDKIQKYEHSFTDYYGVKRHIYASWINIYNALKNTDITRFVYRFPTSLDAYNKITVESDRQPVVEARDFMWAGIATTEIEYIDKQIWYAEMMYDGALLPMEN